MLQNAYFLAKIGADTAENERNFAEIMPKIGNYPSAVRFCFRCDGLRVVELRLPEEGRALEDERLPFTVHLPRNFLNFGLWARLQQSNIFYSQLHFGPKIFTVTERT